MNTIAFEEVPHEVAERVAAGVVHSPLKPSAAEKLLELRLGGENWATVTRSPGAETVQVIRYWELDPDWDSRGDDEYSQWAAVRRASRTTTLPAETDAIVAAVLRGKENE